MENRKEVEIGNEAFIEKIFQMTYGIKSIALYYNPEKLAEVREAVKLLRSSFKADYGREGCSYDVEECRKAYMFAYYPYHIYPAYSIVKEFVAPNLKNRQTINMQYFACGPGPEIYGTIKSLAENGGGAKATKL